MISDLTYILLHRFFDFVFDFVIQEELRQRGQGLNDHKDVLKLHRCSTNIESMLGVFPFPVFSRSLNLFFLLFIFLFLYFLSTIIY